ncbi:phosphoadenosine phosphosulfate reductase family protein [Lacrimispora celerecrescens]|uniref:phosphoadenosine phosphosulfate reductase domain-containing protein n=1 Tax=Lacrimispora celerecrescens TaxID=29354 RepID=UPI00056DB2FE|nr:phosphoadenosine phosphosulfate reductase family protein [Lacrimispora celerecrescens]
MYQYTWDTETGGILLTNELSKFSKEPRPVYYKELDILGFDQHFNYPKDDTVPIMWAEANNYIYRGNVIAKAKGGQLYNPPEIVFQDGKDVLELVPVDIKSMIEKNRELMQSLTQETIQKIYNTYRSYKRKVDIFYVAFSGGKDSVVTLDLVQRALPHDEFIVLFGDTGMEFPDTYEAVELVRLECEKKGIDFQVAKAEDKPLDTWRKFGPPSSVTRWCCSVHKTAPQILKLRELLQKPDFTGMAFVGVRADESLARSKYDYVSYGEKHKGQYSCNAILDWSSAEIFLYIYQQNLIFNNAYKKGNRRAGCLICPKAAERNDFMNHLCYREQAEPFVDIIREEYKRNFLSKEALDEFIQAGGWKARKNGRDLELIVSYNEKRMNDNSVKITVDNATTSWKEWIKTIGVLGNDASPYTIMFKGKIITFAVEQNENSISVLIDGITAKDNIEFVKLLKNVFRKTASCVACRECQADCPYGCMDFVKGQVVISDNCHHCAQCHKVDKGCLVYKSLEQPKGGIIMSGKNMSLNSYSHHAPKMEWFTQYFEFKNEFDDRHSLGSQMYSFFRRFLRDARLLDETGFSRTAKIVDKLGLENQQSWGIIYINLCYAPQVSWYVNRTTFDETYPKDYLTTLMIEDGAKETWTNDIFSSLSRICELPIGELGLGKIEKEKNRIVAITRKRWEVPDALVVLYALYKFAENCGEYYQFTLSNLLDNEIERDGVSPTRIFGIEKDEMVRILNGLTINYSEYISASFTLDLDNITLRAEKTSMDVLELFN